MTERKKPAGRKTTTKRPATTRAKAKPKSEAKKPEEEVKVLKVLTEKPVVEETIQTPEQKQPQVQVPETKQPEVQPSLDLKVSASISDVDTDTLHRKNKRELIALIKEMKESDNAK